MDGLIRAMFSLNERKTLVLIGAEQEGNGLPPEAESGWAGVLCQ